MYGMGRIEGKACIVTGAGSGIGRATAIRLAEEGGRVLCVDLSAETAEETARGIDGAIAVAADVSDPRAVDRYTALCAERFGGVDVVVHAAGRMDLAPLADFDLAVLDEQVRVNVRGTFVVSQQAVRTLRDGGALINFSSSVVGLAFPTYSGYAATKGAVEAMTLVLARELRGRDVTVNVVAPGPTATDLFLDGKDQETIDRLASQPPLERLGQPEDIANVVSFLAGPDGRWVNGQILRANGGVI